MIQDLPQALIDTTTSILFEKKDHLIKRLRNLTDEQKQEVIDFFRKKPNLENRIDWNRRDLNYEDFLEVMDPKGLRAWSQKRMVKSSGIRGLTEGEDYIALDAPEGIDAYIPLNHEASRLIACSNLGSGSTTWCTAREGDASFWKQYIENDNVLIYILYPDTKEALVYDKDNSELVELRNADNDEIEETDIHRKILEKNIRTIDGANPQVDIVEPDEESVIERAEEMATEYYRHMVGSITDMEDPYYAWSSVTEYEMHTFLLNLRSHIKSDFTFDSWLENTLDVGGSDDESSTIRRYIFHRIYSFFVPVYKNVNGEEYELAEPTNDAGWILGDEEARSLIDLRRSVRFHTPESLNGQEEPQLLVGYINDAGPNIFEEMGRNGFKVPLLFKFNNSDPDAVGDLERSKSIAKDHHPYPDDLTELETLLFAIDTIRFLWSSEIVEAAFGGSSRRDWVEENIVDFYEEAYESLKNMLNR